METTGDRAFRVGMYVSGAAHAGLILWLLVGGLFQARPSDDPLAGADVSILSEQEFAALTAVPAAPEVEETAPEPIANDAVDEAPELSTASEDTVPSEAPQTAEPLAEPDIPAEAPETTPAPPVPDQPDAPEGTALALAPSRTPSPRPAPRVAPTAAPPPPPDAEDAPDNQEATTPDPEAVAPDPVEESETSTAPQEAADRIVPPDSEEEQGGPVVSRLAPSGSPRPQSRPARRAPAPSSDAADQETDPIAAAVAAAVAEAPTGPAATGPPLTQGEREGLRLSVQECWVVDVGSEAASVTVTLAMSMSEDGRVISDTLRMIEASGGSDGAVQSAFQAARRAVLRCQRDGYDLPPEKYAQWRDIEIVFNPDSMRLR